MPPLEGFSEIIIGPKRWGKSFFQESRARAMAKVRTVRAVFYLDPTNRLRSRPGFLEWFSFEEYSSYLGDTGEWPRLSLFHLGDDPESWRPIFQHALYWGNCCICVDEGSVFAPSDRGIQIPEMAKISIMCRGIPDAQGQARACYLIVSNQRAMNLHPTIRDMADTLIVGRLRGRGDRDWLRGVYDAAALDKIDALKMTDTPGRVDRGRWYVAEPIGGTLPALEPVPF